MALSGTSFQGMKMLSGVGIEKCLHDRCLSLHDKVFGKFWRNLLLRSRYYWKKMSQSGNQWGIVRRRCHFLSSHWELVIQEERDKSRAQKRCRDSKVCSYSLFHRRRYDQLLSMKGLGSGLGTYLCLVWSPITSSLQRERNNAKWLREKSWDNCPGPKNWRT